MTPFPQPGHGAYKGTLWDPIAKIGAGQVARNSNLKLGDRPPAPVLRPGPATGPLLSQFFLLGQKAAMLLVRPLGRELQVEFAHRGLSLGGPQRDSRSVPVLGDPRVVALSE